MREVETDYLVVGAGASGMAFTDALIAESDAEVMLVDRRHRPGGHWNDAYPFVRLHQPSANYGVNSRVLGNDRVDESGPNAGFYERATAAEICDYYNRVLEEQFLPSGQVRFYGMSEYRNGDGHHIMSTLTGETMSVRVRRKLVDATYVESEIPFRHTPSFRVDPEVRVVSPNDLVNLLDPASGYTVIGAGKTAMDTCNWLLDERVDPDRIRWIRPRDGWLMNRDCFQPLDEVGSYMEFQAAWISAGAEVGTGSEFAERLEARDMFLRIDRAVEPEVFRGATVSTIELEALRGIENVVRLGKVRGVSTSEVTLEQGSIPSDPDQVYVNCTAAGVRPVERKAVFDDDRITMQYVTIGIVPWSAATIGTVEAMHHDDETKNRLCPPIVFTGRIADVLEMLLTAMTGLTARGMDPAVGPWNDSSRLNPAKGAHDHLDDPRVPAAFASIGASFGPAIENLERILGVPASAG